MSSHSVAKANDGLEIGRALESQGCPKLRQNGSHAIYELPNKQQMVVPQHGHMGKGLKCKLVKIALAAGLTVMLAMWVLPLCKFA